MTDPTVTPTEASTPRRRPNPALLAVAAVAVAAGGFWIGKITADPATQTKVPAGCTAVIQDAHALQGIVGDLATLTSQSIGHVQAGDTQQIDADNAKASALVSRNERITNTLTTDEADCRVAGG
jgi:hypothetical protein